VLGRASSTLEALEAHELAEPCDIGLSDGGKVRLEDWAPRG